MSNIKERVKELLTDHPRYRDDFFGLSCAVWFFEIEEMKVPRDSFLTHYRFGKLTSEESIQRFRRLLQKEFPELRGSNYSKMQEKEKEIREKVIEGDLSSLR